jgi:hypothetical protein
VSDVDQRLAEQRHGSEGVLVVFDVGVPGSRAHPNAHVVRADAAKTAHVVDVDEMSRGGQPHGHQGDQALSPREDLAVRPGLGEHVQGLLERRRPVVDEWRGLHSLILPHAQHGAVRTSSYGPAAGLLRQSDADH